MDPSIQSIDDHMQSKIKADTSEKRPMETVGVYLRNARQTKNLSLNEVAHLTKISELYLDCIEKDDFDKIPKGPYVKGYISSYAHMIGEDTEQALKLYETANPKNQAEDPLPLAPPPAKSWKASVATVFCATIESLQGLKKHRQCLPIFSRPAHPQARPAASLLKKWQAIGDADPDPESSAGTDHETNDKAESSVLIPFKKNTSPPQADVATGHEPLSPMNPMGLMKDDVVSSISKKLIGIFVTIGLWLQSFFGNLSVKCRSIPLRSLLTAIAGLIVGGAVLVFCGFGVYHVFFFDPYASMSAQAEFGRDSMATLPLPEQLTIPHKKSRFKKPDAPMPAPVIVPLPPAPPTERLPLAPKPTTAAAPSMKDKKPDSADVIPAITVGEVTKTEQPVDINIKILKATTCSAIKDRLPADSVAAFPVSVERVYVWSHVQAKTYPTAIRHVYFHEGQIINQVELNIRSPLWRTWSFKTIDQDRYRGNWRVDITSVDGKVLRRLHFKID